MNPVLTRENSSLIVALQFLSSISDSLGSIDPKILAEINSYESHQNALINYSVNSDHLFFQKRHNYHPLAILNTLELSMLNIQKFDTPDYQGYLLQPINCLQEHGKQQMDRAYRTNKLIAIIAQDDQGWYKLITKIDKLWKFYDNNYEGDTLSCMRKGFSSVIYLILTKNLSIIAFIYYSKY